MRFITGVAHAYANVQTTQRKATGADMSGRTLKEDLSVLTRAALSHQVCASAAHNA